jgi:hypothetical protein
MSVDVLQTPFFFRAPEPPRPAAELLAEIRERGGRVYRMRSDRVTCLTDDPELAGWLLAHGGKHYSTPGLAVHSTGGYWRARQITGGKMEWDIWIHTIPAEGSIWEAAG